MNNNPPLKSAIASALVISANNKAGMDGIDRERIDAIILRESENTLYMQQQKRRDDKVNERIERMKQQLLEEQQQTSDWKLPIEQELKTEIQEILQGRRNRSTMCVLDMDMFFMACELLTKPHLKEVPCCVGGGMISTSNYKARQFGVRSGMAGWIGDKLVEELSGGTQKLVHVQSNYDLYQAKSKLAMTVVQEFDPRYRYMGLDEASVDLAPYLAFKLSKNWIHEQVRQHLQSLFGGSNHSTETKDAANNNHHQDNNFDATLQLFSSKECLAAASETVALLRQKVCDATGGLTCSAGLAPTFMIAKIASDFNKPNGQKIVGERLEEDVWPFLRPLSTRKLPGVGRVTQKILQAFGVSTVQHLYDERALVRFLFKPKTAKFLLRASLGGFGSSHDDDIPEEDDENTTTTHLKRKGISRERTFRPGDSWSEINNRLEDIARRLSQDMQEETIYARTVSLKVKLKSFDVLQRCRTVARAVQSGDDLLTHAGEMLRELRKEEYNKGNRTFALRLIGVRCSNLVQAADVASQVANQQCMANFLSSGGGLNTTGTNTQTISTTAPKKKHLLSPKPIQAKRTGAGPNINQTLDAYTKQVGTAAKKRPLSPKPLQAQRSPPSLLAAKPQQHSTDCPICNRPITADSSDALNRALNHHIDACLNAPVVRQAVQEETNRFCGGAPSGKKTRRLTDFFSK